MQAMQKNRVLHKLVYEKSNDKLVGKKRKSNTVKKEAV